MTILEYGIYIEKLKLTAQNVFTYNKSFICRNKMIGHYYIHCSSELLNFLKFQSTVYIVLIEHLVHLTISVLVLYLDPPKLVRT